jgi:hydroxypyruvate isomerase
VNENEIRGHAEKAMSEYGLSDKAYLESIGQRYVKLVGDRHEPGKVETKKAWVARFIDDALYKGAWVELVLDDEGTVLRVDRSR